MIFVRVMAGICWKRYGNERRKCRFRVRRVEMHIFDGVGDAGEDGVQQPVFDGVRALHVPGVHGNFLVTEAIVVLVG